MVKTWGACSRSCGTGQKTRFVGCIRTIDNKLVTKTLCPAPTPITRKYCNKEVCPKQYEWKSNEWGQCDRTCGGGVKLRTVNCVVKGTSSPIDTRYCMENKPSVVEPCSIQECESYIFNIHLEGRCSKSCGSGLKARIVYCINKKSRSIVANRYCDGPSPPRIVRCNTNPCPRFEWKLDRLLPCSVTCGSGIKRKLFLCINIATSREVNRRNCGKNEEKEEEICKMGVCEPSLSR